MSAKRFCLALLGLSAAFLAMAAGVVYAVDPFNILGRNWAGLHVASEREAKPSMLRDGPHRVVLLGSSKTAYIDPGRLCLPGVFNASFPAAVPEEMLELVQEAVTDARLVLLGLDLFMFNEREVPLREDSFPDAGMVRTLGYLLGWRPLDRALHTLVRHWRGDEPYLRANGSRTAVQQLARHARMPAPDHADALDYLMARHYGGFAFSTARLRALEELKSLLEERGMRYRAFVSPLSEPILARLRADPAWEELLRFRRELRRLFPDLIDLSESAYSATEGFFRFDPLHYLPEAGARFMNEAVLCGLCPGSEEGAGCREGSGRQG